MTSPAPPAPGRLAGGPLPPNGFGAGLAPPVAAEPLASDRRAAAPLGPDRLAAKPHPPVAAELPSPDGVAANGRAADRLQSRRLYLCTADRPDLASFLAACISGGVDLVQLRDKHLDARPLLARARLALAVCRDHGVPFILNDRPDLALEVGADGVHVGQDDAPPALARRILGPDAIVGLSTHAPAELDAAAGEPVDYLSAGPVVATPTKPGRPGTGLDYLRYASRTATRPWFVTGGATPLTVGDMVAAGARRFVVVRWLTESADPRPAARALRDAIDRSIDRAAAATQSTG